MHFRLGHCLGSSVSGFHIWGPTIIHLSFFIGDVNSVIQSRCFLNSPLCNSYVSFLAVCGDTLRPYSCLAHKNAPPGFNIYWWVLSNPVFYCVGAYIHTSLSSRVQSLHYSQCSTFCNIFWNKLFCKKRLLKSQEDLFAALIDKNNSLYHEKMSTLASGCWIKCQLFKYTEYWNNYFIICIPWRH